MPGSYRSCMPACHQCACLGHGMCTEPFTTRGIHCHLFQIVNGNPCLWTTASGKGVPHRMNKAPGVAAGEADAVAKPLAAVREPSPGAIHGPNPSHATASPQHYWQALCIPDRGHVVHGPSAPASPPPPRRRKGVDEGATTFRSCGTDSWLAA